MPSHHGDFFWYELLTSDSTAAQEFYSKILPWTYKNNANPDMDYPCIWTKNGPVGGVMKLTEEMKKKNASPCWMGYIKVDDCESTAKAIKADGGTIRMEPFSVDNVGKLSFVSDAQGAMFYLIEPVPSSDNPDCSSRSFNSGKDALEGHCSWNELATTDQDEAVEFYTKHFGWKEGEAMDMGPMGKYKLFSHGGSMISGIMPKPDTMPMSWWTFYFAVANIDQAVKAVEENGGKVTLQPTPVPGDLFQINAQDPQGAHFALVGPRT